MATRSGIPTDFSWRRYRSRLEARWAAFFSLLGWRFEYEPLDLDGWIPDFGIFGSTGRLAILVEVKSYSTLAEFEADGVAARYLGARDTRWPENLAPLRPVRPRIMLAGLRVFEGTFHPAAIGWITDADLWGGGFGEAALHDHELVRHEYPAPSWLGWDVFHSTGAYQCVLSGTWDGARHLAPAGFERVRRLWNEAANLVQWKASA